MLTLITGFSAIVFSAKFAAVIVASGRSTSVKFAGKCQFVASTEPAHKQNHHTRASKTLSCIACVTDDSEEEKALLFWSAIEDLLNGLVVDHFPSEALVGEMCVLYILYVLALKSAHKNTNITEQP